MTERKPGSMERLAKYGKGMAAAAALGAMEPSCLPGELGCATPDVVEAGRTETARERGPVNEYFDSDPDYFLQVEKGEFSKAERKRRTEKLNNGEEIFRDIGLTFYHVKRGDTISEIRRDLAKYEEFAYLKDQPDKLQSFNIRAKDIEAGMWLPIPLEEKDRHVTDEQFAEYADRAIDDMEQNDRYGEHVKAILDKISRRELVATMVAIAKQESGGKPIGQMELHRWEDRYHAFSFSIFHVLMEKGGPGLRARKHLDLTEGQLYHPENAVKLFLAFVVEKGLHDLGNQPEEYFPIDENAEKFAVFYNGTGWKRINPLYVENITRYYEEALEELKNG